MQDGLYVALSSQMALEKRLTTIADNVANMSTVGFRATEVRFNDVVTGVGRNAVSFSSSGRSSHGATTSWPGTTSPNSGRSQRSKARGGVIRRAAVPLRSWGLRPRSPHIHSWACRTESQGSRV